MINKYKSYSEDQCSHCGYQVILGAFTESVLMLIATSHNTFTGLESLPKRVSAYNYRNTTKHQYRWKESDNRILDISANLQTPSAFDQS